MKERERPDRDPPKHDQVNTTGIRTKSGTEVFVLGKAVKGDYKKRCKAGDRFVDVYNRNFTVEEQKQVGNVLYDLYRSSPDSADDNIAKKKYVAQTGTVIGNVAKKFNPHHKKMVDVEIAPDCRNDEGVITHEMIHGKKFMRGVDGRHHNEHKIEFETIGRISRHSIVGLQHGYYFSPAGNPYLAKKKIRLSKKHEIVKEGLYADRRLLTGSLAKSIIGDTAERRANKLFRKSFFFKRTFH